METIIYKGVSFEAELIGGINREHKWAPGRDSYDSLFRDAAGRYYIHRWTENETPGSLGLTARGRFTGEVITKKPTKGGRVRPPRELVHAISLNAAILWATWELGNGETANLRADAADLLKALKTPEFSHAEGGSFALDDLARTMLQRVCREGDDCRYAGEDPRDLVNAAVTFYLCDGSDNEVRGDFDLSSGDDALERAKQDRLKMERNAEGASVSLLRFMDLDDRARQLLREHRTDHPEDDLRDVLNGAVDFLLGDPDDSQFDRLSSEGVVRVAMERRLGTEANGVPVVVPVAEADPHPYATPVRELTRPGDGGIHRFVFTYAPTGKRAGRRLTVEVTGKQWQEIEALAAHFKMRAPFFLRLLMVDELPGQPTFRRRKRAPLEKRLKAKHVMFACSDEALHRRIERVTQAREMSWDEYVADALGRDADSHEENMIVHPRTGELLRADRDDLWTEMEEDVRFQDRAPLPLKRDKVSQAADRPDVALCAAALPDGDGDEEDEDLPADGKTPEGAE